MTLVFDRQAIVSKVRHYIIPDLCTIVSSPFESRIVSARAEFDASRSGNHRLIPSLPSIMIIQTLAARDDLIFIVPSDLLVPLPSHFLKNRFDSDSLRVREFGAESEKVEVDLSGRRRGSLFVDCFVVIRVAGVVAKASQGFLWRDHDHLHELEDWMNCDFGSFLELLAARCFSEQDAVELRVLR